MPKTSGISMNIPTKNPNKFIKFITFFLLYSWAVAAADSDDSSSTQEYMEPEDDLAELILKNLSLEMLQNDLKDRFSARFQLEANLKLTSSHRSYDQRLFQLPLVCIGTGRISETQHLHACRTTIQAIDVCIDIKERVRPDHVCDCFNMSYAHLIPQSPFGAIFFAHVGADGLPLDDNAKESLKKYYNALILGGLFVYNSEVIHLMSLKARISAHGVSTFEELQANWRTMLEQVGFTKIEILMKDESKHYQAHSISILIVAKK